MASSDAMIQADGLTKKFGSFTAVQDLSFEIEAGEVVAFVGPNGAGKTTAMRMLTGFLSPTAGRAYVCGMDVFDNRIAAAEQLGYLPEGGPLYTDMTPEGLLDFFGRTRGLSAGERTERIAKVVDLCELEEVSGKRIGKLSKGYRQRVGLAQVLLHEPQVLILDEPTTGLDPNQTEDVRHTLRRLGKERTVLLSTHLMQEVEAIASRVLMIARGELRFDGTVEELRHKSSGEQLEDAFRKISQRESVGADADEEQ
jgi:ABC-2 type transport system ATP-binding protein